MGTFQPAIPAILGPGHLRLRPDFRSTTEITHGRGVAVNLFLDAIPHSVAAIIQNMCISVAQAFFCPDKINRADDLAALLGLQWAAGEELLDRP